MADIARTFGRSSSLPHLHGRQWLGVLRKTYRKLRKPCFFLAIRSSFFKNNSSLVPVCSSWKLDFGHFESFPSLHRAEHLVDVDFLRNWTGCSHPKDPEHLLRPGELRATFAELEVLRDEAGEVLKIPCPQD